MKLTCTRPGQTLAQALQAAHAYVSMPCGGKGTCGKCAVLIQGALDTPSPQEKALLARIPKPDTPRGFAWRMACQCRMLGDCQVLLPNENHAPVTAAFSMALPHASAHGLGAAMDIGTTTISLALYDLKAAALLATIHEMNRQAAFGADVLSRIEAANQHGVAQQQACIEGQLAHMLKTACAKTNESTAHIRRMVITGNTTMLHLLTGLDPRGIGVAPFIPASLFGDSQTICGIATHLPRCVSAYVGADITCGLLSTGLCAPGQTRLLVDVGTNGEMALFAQGRLLCCATAAGPAFEGAQISMGMPATEGAIDKVSLQDGQLVCHVIGDGKPLGICGTGLISALYRMLEMGAMDETGRLGNGDIFGLGNSGVYLTQQDVRNVQLAKASIAAGIDALLHAAGLMAEAVDILYLSGGFGSFMNSQEAAGIGLVPAALACKTVPVGNTALSGAVKLLFDETLRQEATGLAQSAQEIPLATNPYFMARYLDRMAFEEE